MTYTFAVIDAKGDRINGGTLYNTKKEAANAKAALELRIYEREGKFPSDLKVVRVY